MVEALVEVRVALAQYAQSFVEPLSCELGQIFIERALVGRGESLVRTGRAEEAVSLLEEATRSGGSAGEGDAQDEERAVALYWLGEAHSRAGDRSEAIPPYRSLVREYPAHALTPYGAYNLAGILREMRRPTDGLALLDGLEDTRLPADLRDPVRLLKGDLALATGDEGRAARDYGRVESPDLRPRALAGIAYAARAAGDRRLLDEARRELQERFGRTSHAADIDLLLGAWEAEEGKVEEADRALSAHLQGPRGREARFHRAWARVVAERHGEAAALLGELATGDDDWALRAGARLEGELRLAAEWQAALNAALEFLRRHSDAEPAAQVFAGAVESAFRLRRDDDVLRLEALFKEHFAGRDLAREVTHFAAVAALRGGDLDGAITRLRSLHRDSAGEARAELAPRLAWALYQRDPESSGDEIEALLPGLGGSAAAEVGILLGRARRAEGSASEAHAAFRAARTAGGEGDAGARAALEEAVLLLEDGEDELAAAAYTGILQGSPPPEVEASALIDLAELRARTGKCGAAIPLFERLLEHPVAERHETATRIGLAFCLWSGGDAGRALEVLEELDRDGLEPALAAEAI
ncbi:MAG: tetratricopeptide repeat protein, partial [Planctomycetota bacterium]